MQAVSRNLHVDLDHANGLRSPQRQDMAQHPQQGSSLQQPEPLLQQAQFQDGGFGTIIQRQDTTIDEAAACTAQNLDSMLLTKDAALSMFTLELMLKDWGQSHGFAYHHSVLLGSYFLVATPDGATLHQITACRFGAADHPIFTTASGEEVPYERMSESYHCPEEQVFLEQTRILTQGKHARLKQLEVADASAAFRQQLCLDYFTLHKQLNTHELSGEARADLLEQLEDKLVQTQPPQAIIDAVDCNVEAQEQATRLQLEELARQRKLIGDAQRDSSEVPSAWQQLGRLQHEAAGMAAPGRADSAAPLQQQQETALLIAEAAKAREALQAVLHEKEAEVHALQAGLAEQERYFKALQGSHAEDTLGLQATDAHVGDAHEAGVTQAQAKAASLQAAAYLLSQANGAIHSDSNVHLTVTVIHESI
ncbi:hypothetical protein ABBQ38_014847 [Trebouxia sp. C0009 RCD-2024]